MEQVVVILDAHEVYAAIPVVSTFTSDDLNEVNFVASQYGQFARLVPLCEKCCVGEIMEKIYGMNGGK